MLSRNLYILAGTLLFFSALSYVMGASGLAHEPGAPSESSLWHMIGIVLLLMALFVALLGVLQSMFEQADRRTPGGQAGVRRRYLESQAHAKLQKQGKPGRPKLP